MKRFLKSGISFILAITLVFSSAYVGLSEADFGGFFAVSVEAASVDDLTFTLNADGESYTVAKCDTSASGEIVIPDTYNSLPVVKIKDSAFYMCNGITSVIIPDSVIMLGDYVFSDCHSLACVTLPKGLTSIGSYLFGNCLKLTGIIIPDGVTRIGDYAFWNCRSLETLKIPDGVTSIGEYAFGDCHSLKSLVIPQGVTNIANGTFNECRSMTSITLPEGITNIGANSFCRCTALTEIKVPDKVKTIGNYAFSYCLNLKSAIIPDGVSNIPYEAFTGCTELVSVTIPSSVKNVENYAFYKCQNLKYVFYTGTQQQWGKITLGKENARLSSATVHYGAKDHTISDSWVENKYEGLKYKGCTVCGMVIESVEIPQIAPLTPKTTTVNAVGGIKVSWNKVDGAVKYVIYRRTAGSKAWVNVGNTTELSFIDESVNSGTYYCYSVRAYNKSGDYSPYNASMTNTRKYMASPKLTTIYNHVNGLAIKWNAVAGVTNGYRVYRRGAGSTYWTYLGTTKNLYWIDSGVKNANGGYYRYTVIADGGYHSAFDTTGLYLKRLANPALKSATSGNGGITVKWSAIKGTTGYYVYRKTANSGWQRLAAVGGTNNTTYIDKTAKSGVTYTYTVRACSGYTLSSYNSGISCRR